MGDALPGIVQTDSPFRELRDDRDAGHACGHHLFGAASAWAAVAVKEWLNTNKIKGELDSIVLLQKKVALVKSIWCRWII